jgi:carbon-monoxide dehydrogenase small subunit
VERVTLAFEVNGLPATAEVEPDRLLVDLLRDELGLTGTKVGCSVGVCGVCAVLVDGRLLSACLLPAVRIQGRSVVTVEGLAAADGGLSPVQAAFIAHGGFQCGICTPGQVVAATALLAEHPDPAEAELTEWMTGQLCRCTGYGGIRRSIRAAAAEIAGSPRADTLPSSEGSR